MKVVYPVRKRGKDASRYVKVPLSYHRFLVGRTMRAQSVLEWVFDNLNPRELWCPK